MSKCRVVSCVVGRGCLLWLVHSLGKTLLAFPLFHFVLQGQTCLLFQVSLDFLLLHSSHLWWKVHLFLEKTLKDPLDCKEIKLVNPKGNQSWILIGRTDAEAEAPIHWPPDEKNWLIGAGKEWRHGEKMVTEDEIVGWHYWLTGHDFEQSHGHDYLWEIVKDREVWHAVVHGVTKS